MSSCLGEQTQSLTDLVLLELEYSRLCLGGFVGQCSMLLGQENCPLTWQSKDFFQLCFQKLGNSYGQGLKGTCLIVGHIYNMKENGRGRKEKVLLVLALITR
jgi:hypothetical protein